MTTTETSLPATYAAIVSSVAPGTYQVTVRAEAASGTIVSAECPTVFHIGALTVTKLSDADEMTLNPVYSELRGRMPIRPGFRR
jgi:hypothetical protein